MSESTIPFVGQTMDEAVPVPADEAPAAGSRAKLLVVLGVAGLLVLGVLAYFLVFSGSSGTPEAAAPKAPQVVTPAENEAAVPASDAGKRGKLSNRNFGRDPFKALIVEAVAVSETPTAGDTSTADGVTGDSTTGDSSSGTGDTTTSTTTVPNETEAHTFKVVDVAPDNSRVSVRVDGEVYRNLKAGEVFATYFKVVLIGGTVNSFQFGDDKFNVVGTKRLTIA